MIVAHELRLADQIELLDSAAHSVQRDSRIITYNPLGQVPTLLLNDGTMVADSSVICDYLDALKQGRIFPATGEARWRALTDQAVADGMMEASLLARYERAVRPPDKLWQDWLAGHLDKIDTCLQAFNRAAPQFGKRFDIGTIALGCALAYLDLRFPDIDWRVAYPNLRDWHAAFEERPSLQATRLH
jgi:glutathione S-transferase